MTTEPSSATERGSSTADGVSFTSVTVTLTWALADLKSLAPRVERRPVGVERVVAAGMDDDRAVLGDRAGIVNGRRRVVHLGDRDVDLGAGRLEVVGAESGAASGGGGACRCRGDG